MEVSVLFYPQQILTNVVIPFAVEIQFASIYLGDMCVNVMGTLLECTAMKVSIISLGCILQRVVSGLRLTIFDINLNFSQVG